MRHARALIALERRKPRAMEILRAIVRRGLLRGGGVVYMSDVNDLRRLQRHFPTILLLPV